MAVTPAGAFASPTGMDAADWLPAQVPGTAVMALRDAGRHAIDNLLPLHDKDVWFRRVLAGTGEHRLALEGLATIAEVYLDGVPILVSQTMFARH